jgi:hypothetical protein
MISGLKANPARGRRAPGPSRLSCVVADGSRITRKNSKIQRSGASEQEAAPGS